MVAFYLRKKTLWTWNVFQVKAKYYCFPVELAGIEVKDIKDFIMTVDRISSYNEEIEKIITEDAEPFFAGQKSAEEVAKVIQSRVNIYINEKQ